MFLVQIPMVYLYYFFTYVNVFYTTKCHVTLFQTILLCRSFKSATNNWVRKSQIRKSKNTLYIWSANRKIANCHILRKVCKSILKIKSANLRICDLRNFFADRQPLRKTDYFMNGTKVARKASCISIILN